MTDDDKKKNHEDGAKDAGEKGGGKAVAGVGPEAADATVIEPAEGESIVEPEVESTESGDTVAASCAGVPEAGEPEPRPAISLEALARLSRGQGGQIHFRDRDVVVIADGGAAAEVFRLFANRRSPDTFAPSQASWVSSWFSYDPEELLGVTWYPRDLASERRPVIDPVVPGAA